MANNRLVLEGLDELRAALRALPAELRDEARGIVLESASSAHDEIDAVYQAHAITGNLSRGLKYKPTDVGPYGTGALLESKAKHAWLFDNGSQARHYVTGLGHIHATGRMWGRTPPTHVFVRTVSRWRRRMYERLKALVASKGLTVEGDAG